MAKNVWTPAERVFRGWMLISAGMYALGAAAFLVIGASIPGVINAISRYTLPLPLYPMPTDAPEGAFWRILSVSMMAMLTWISVQAYRDPRRHGNMIPILLLSKTCSTACYTVFFIRHGHLAYMVGFLTDGPIFLVTALLWYAAAGGERNLTRGEDRILAALGEAFMPRGGRFDLGFADVREASLDGTTRMLAVMDVPTLLAMRLSLHFLNWTPVPAFGRRLVSLSADRRAEWLMRLEARRSVMLRTCVIIAKVLILVPFFEQPEAMDAVGYDPAARVRP
ncbi:MAG TPA: hypothetical protein P5318_04990 [Candidatus Hydrogenedentes bacterium]|nr:hypothetical protein [Candidatus Hydrogenedentota bacterium]HPC15643.1 hypothetical protein [Candidatus Hydrogenedentota bacterium]HRT19463.1 hypothetical protein [Candidatus Hydrogenedentota bacterium]HRT63803.1 hypothetical protein [Candidatus Hydrogenedentota bacterium]